MSVIGPAAYYVTSSCPELIPTLIRVLLRKDRLPIELGQYFVA
jgi:hypothetical protein